LDKEWHGGFLLEEGDQKGALKEDLIPRPFNRMINQQLRAWQSKHSRAHAANSALEPAKRTSNVSPVANCPPTRVFLSGLQEGEEQRTTCHWDAFNQVIVAVAGKNKTFRISKPDFSSEAFRQEDPEEAVDVKLEPGDVLYLPGRWRHSVRTGAGLQCTVNFGFPPLTPHMHYGKEVTF